MDGRVFLQRFRFPGRDVDSFVIPTSELQSRPEAEICLPDGEPNGIRIDGPQIKIGLLLALESGYDGYSDAYLDNIMEAARLSNVSPYVLAATIVVEQGRKGTSDLISGTYPGFEGYYNFFNFGASGSNVVVSGLTYAKNAMILKYLYDDPDGVIPTPTPTPEPVIPKGDTNQDGAINAVDLAAVKMHILGVRALSGNAAVAGDVNGDGAINAVDLAAIKMHILGVKTIG